MSAPKLLYQTLNVNPQEFKLLKQPGEYVPPLTTFLGRMASCIFIAPTYEELQSRLDKAMSLISFS